MGTKSSKTKQGSSRDSGKKGGKKGGRSGRRGSAARATAGRKAGRVVRGALQGSTDLASFLDGVQALTLSDRKQLVDQALVLLEQNYVHLPLKRAMHAVDPVQRLRLIRHRLDAQTLSSMEPEIEFHRDMIEAFVSVRDLHTNYLLPRPLAEVVAYLPFLVEECFEDGDPHYLVTHLAQDFSHASFKRGVEVLSWNGVPIERAIELNARRHAGSNAAARHSRGLENLTLRALRAALPPDERWVIVGYRDAAGTDRELRQEWLVAGGLPAGGGDTDSGVETASCQGLDLELDIIGRMKKALFVRQDRARTRKKKSRAARARIAAGQDVPSTSDVLRAQIVETASGEFGYVRIFSFNVQDPDAFVAEFIRLAGLLPKEGLIIDVRGNGGGHIHASERLLQVLTPRSIEPEPVQFINTPLNLRICERHENNPVGLDLSPWVGSVRRAIQTGATYSRAFPITSAASANALGQKYHGPVVLITDARCYSATDIFAAGFQDHGIGPVLGVEANTGAGGANVWDHGLLKQLLQVPAPMDTSSPYGDLPRGAGMRVSIRRTLRVGERSGTPLEDLGVTPDQRHHMTRADLLNRNADLLDRAGALLVAQPVRQLDVSATRHGQLLKLKLNTRGIQRVDVYVDGRPAISQNVQEGEHEVADVPAGQNPRLLEVRGFHSGDLVAARRQSL